MAFDLSGYKLTFDDEFNNLSVSHSGTGTTWTDQLWYGGAYGQASFASVNSAVNPFSVANGVLTISADNVNGNWQGGLLSSVSPSGVGFAQEYGYFEMRAQLPAAQGAWPAFWMLSIDHLLGSSDHVELDIMEAQGNRPTDLYTTVHSYATGVHTQNANNFTTVTNESNGFHTYGMAWNANTITFYYDGQAVEQVATPPDANKPMYLLANLAMGDMIGSNSIDGGTPNHLEMKIDYVRAYSNAPGAIPVGSTPSPSPTPTPTPAAGGTGTLTVRASADHFQGDAKFDVIVDGKMIGEYAVSAVHSQGAWQDISVTGAFDPTQAHDVKIAFGNDGGDGQGGEGHDMNLYVDAITLGGVRYEGESAVSNTASLGYGAMDPTAAVMVTNGVVDFATRATSSSPSPAAGIIGLPVVTAANVSTTRGSPALAASALVQASAPSGATITQYQFLNLTPGGGGFAVHGVAQPYHTYVNVAPADLGSVTFRPGAGADDLWVRVNDGLAWSDWAEFSVTGPINHAPVVSASDVTLAKGVVPTAASLFHVSDADGDAIAQYQFLDLTPGSGNFAVSGVAQPFHTYINVAAADLGSVTFRPGAGTDDLWVRANDGLAWSDWTEVEVTGPVNRAPVVTAGNVTVAKGAVPTAASLFQVSDPDGDAIAQYQFLDLTAGSGSFAVNGVAQPFHTYVNVAAADLGSVTFQPGSGTDDLWVRANDGTLWSDWTEFEVAGPVNHAPVVTARDQSFGKGVIPSAASLISVSDPDGDAIAQYQFLDLTAGNGSFAVNGVAQPFHTYVNVAASDLGKVTFQPGSGTDDLWVRANDGLAWSDWTEFEVTGPVNRAPVVTAGNVTVAKGVVPTAASLFQVSDPDGDAIAQYQFLDLTAGSGSFAVNGVAQPFHTYVNVAAANLGSATFQPGSGTDDLWVRANDGLAWSDWTEFALTGPVNHAPTVAASDVTVAPGAAPAAASLFSASDPDGDAIAQYQFLDLTRGSGHFAVSGAAQPDHVYVNVAASDLGKVTFQPGAGTDDLWVRANDGLAWSDWAEFHLSVSVAGSATLTAPATGQHDGVILAASG